MPQFLTLTPVAPAGAQLDVALYGYTMRLTGHVEGVRAFAFDVAPTHRPGLRAVIEAAVAGTDQTLTVPEWHAGISSAGGVLTVSGQGRGETPERSTWTLGPEAARELRDWLGAG